MSSIPTNEHSEHGDPAAAVKRRTSNPARTVPPHSLRDRRPDNPIDYFILGIATLVLSVTGGLLLYVVTIQAQTYQKAIDRELGLLGQIDHSAVLSYARSADVSATKISALFLGFLLIFLGSLFVLRIGRTQYALSLSAAENRNMAFSTTSPGLVMITLGVVLVSLVLFARSTVDYRPALASHPLTVVEDLAD